MQNGEHAVGIDYSMLGFSILLAVVVELLSSIYPAVKAARFDPTVALRAL